jgi:nucleoside-diphosphate-sugar epimerase
MISISDYSSLALNDIDLGEFHDTNVCLLGGSGFIGTWLVTALHQLNQVQGIRVDLTIYTRDKAKTLIAFPNASFKRLRIEEFDFSKGTCDLGMFDFFFNGATPTSIKPGSDSKSIFFDPTINAVQSIIDSAKKYGNYPRVLNLSSGAVYGDQPMELSHRLEGAAKDLQSSDDDYRASKIVSEQKLASPEIIEVMRSSSPRLFTFYGPGIPLDKHFAIGNFIRDGLNGQPINVQGNPNTRRSYMFPADLVSWLLKAILNPQTTNLNVGSENSVTMLEIASMVSNLTSKKGVALLCPTTVANNYVPSTKNFRSIYSVEESIDLEKGLGLWAEWLTRKQQVR